MLAYEDYDYVDLQTFRPRKRRTKKQNKRQQTSGLYLTKIEPKTKNQRAVFDAYQNDKHCVLHGVAGTGKTYISSFLALDEMLTYNQRQKIIFIRSIVPSRDIGFLPGNEAEKAKVYETPYISIVNELLRRDDGYEILKRKKQIEFMTTSFLRGITLNNSIIIIDEAQNMSFHELDTIITRIGTNTRLMIVGDFCQSDLQNNGLMKFISILNKIKSFEFIDFNTNDIVRSDMVKDYIIAKQMYG